MSSRGVVALDRRVSLKTRKIRAVSGGAVLGRACSARQCQISQTPASRVKLGSMSPFRVTLALLAMLSPSVFASAQSGKPEAQKSGENCPAHDEHAKMNERGEQGMGFSQTATTHHFFLKPDGGTIQVEANDPKDTGSRDFIRAHLMHIAHAFSQGDFDIPMFVHDTVPPGEPEMERLKDKINYSFRETPNGGKVVIATSDPDALVAIHKFLRFQIAEHQTHDPTTVQ
jgi:hypothetical protein